MSIHRFFERGPVDLPGLTTFLDGLAPAARVATTRTLTAKEQARLFEAAKHYRRVTLDDFVPKHLPPLEEVIHHGRNSLLAFSNFQKRMCRPPPDEEGRHADQLWGYNEQTFRWATGPGYFLTKPVDEWEVVIDYFDVPPHKPEAWPMIRPNHARLSRFVYHKTRDFMRGVSEHVSIGRASRDGKTMDNWFVLCRDA